MVTIEIESEHVTEIVTGFGVKGVTAEKVAADACDEAAEYLSAGRPGGRSTWPTSCCCRWRSAAAGRFGR